MKDLDMACAHFRSLLEAQMKRVVAMEQQGTELNKAETVTIGLADGDGIGPVIMEQAKRVLQRLLVDELCSGKVILKQISGFTIEDRMAAGKAVPEGAMEQIKKCDVLLKGPTTTPMGGTMESANVTLRRELDLYANVRPVCVPEENIDWTFFRENTEGEYVLGSCGIDLPGMAVDFKVTTDAGTRRIAKAAFEYARNNGKTHLAIVTKANIMKKTDGKFAQIAHEIAEQYPEITVEDYYIDIMTANIINPTIRSKFQVFLLPNLYGDILTDEAAQIQGGVGTAGSANLGTRYAMFEAIHGSAPQMVRDGLKNYANPQSIFRAAAMLLRHIGRGEQAARLERALDQCTAKVTGDRTGLTAAQYTDALLEML